MEHNQRIIFTNDISAAIDEALANIDYNRLFVLTDTNTAYFVLPRLADNAHIAGAHNITIKSGDMNKTIEATAEVWRELCANGATRKSVLINLGGGMVTDLGGFAASTFKRGIRFINVPTTLLSAVDAAVGGKTGVNFRGLKNEIGVFSEAEAVIISTCFFSTLPIAEVKSGFAEMLKHGLLKGAETYDRLLAYDFESRDYDLLLSLLRESVQVKADIVSQDPHEQGLRRALNLGHTAGHAFESLAMSHKSPIPHGHAVAWGMVVELTLANMLCSFPSSRVQEYAKFILENYGAFHITCKDYDALLTLMRHDKKSENGEMNFTLLSDVGEVKINCCASDDDVRAALDIYRDLMHI